MESVKAVIINGKQAIAAGARRDECDAVLAEASTGVGPGWYFQHSGEAEHYEKQFAFWEASSQSMSLIPQAVFKKKMKDIRGQKASMTLAKDKKTTNQNLIAIIHTCALPSQTSKDSERVICQQQLKVCASACIVLSHVKLV